MWYYGANRRLFRLSKWTRSPLTKLMEKIGDIIRYVIFSLYGAFLCYKLLIYLRERIRAKINTSKSFQRELKSLFERSKKVNLYRIRTDLESIEVKIQSFKKSIDGHIPMDYSSISSETDTWPYLSSASPRIAPQDHKSGKKAKYCNESKRWADTPYRAT